MKTVQVEYNQTTGDIVCVRTIDAAIIAPQPIQPGHAEVIIDVERNRAEAESVKRETQAWRVHPATGRVERRPVSGQPGEPHGPI